MRELPSFFIVGAQKAGTTTLHEWLVQQPDVCLPTVKETHFFSDDRRYRLGIEWYLKQFPGFNGPCMKGEVDPDYLFFEAAPLRIREWVGSPKIVFVFRHPIDRAYSHYRMSVRRGYEPLSFTDALTAEKVRLAGRDGELSLHHHSYMARGRYSEQVARYRQVFPEAEFMYVKFDDLFDKHTGLATYEEICSFIGLKSSQVPADRSKKSNRASVPKSKLLRNLLYKPSPIRRGLGRLMPLDFKMRLWRVLDRINRKPISDDEADDDRFANIPAEILDSVGEELLNLQAETGLNLEDWVRKLEDRYADA